MCEDCQYLSVSQRKYVGVGSFSELLHSPLLLAERAAVVLLDPEAHAALVEAVVAVSPHHNAVLPATRVQLRLGLAAETRVHHLHSATRDTSHVIITTCNVVYRVSLILMFFNSANFMAGFDSEFDQF